MTPADLQEVLRIEETTGTPWAADLFVSELELLHGWQYVSQHRETAKISGFIIGTLVIDEAEIRKIAVAPDCRRKKIASSLLEKSLAFLKEQNVANCFLELRKSNIAAFALYQKYGFEVIGERKKYYKDPTEDAFIMKKNLKTGKPLEKH